MKTSIAHNKDLTSQLKDDSKPISAKCTAQILYFNLA